MHRIFISYSHADEQYRTELQIHLSMLKRQGEISIWHDRKIVAGQDFAGEIDSNINNADVVLLLVSSDFLASSYCYEVEMQKALERHEQGKATVIPVILRACDWHSAPFGKLLATPKDGKPVKLHADLDSAFLEIVKAIREALPRRNPQEPQGVSGSGTEAVPVVTHARSGNVYIKKEFSDKDKDDFFMEAFEYMATFFENSLKELAERNPGISQTYRRIDANKFTGTIYKHGKQANRCKIWLAGRGSFENGIAYSEGDVADRDNSINDSLSVEDDGSILYLHTHMGISGIDVDDKLTFEGAAEYYWARFIHSLQY